MTDRHSGSTSSATGQWIGVGGEATSNYSYTSSDDRWDTVGGETPNFRRLQSKGFLLPRNVFTTKRVLSFTSQGGCQIRRAAQPTKGWNASGVHSVNNWSKVIIDWTEVGSYIDDDSLNAASLGAVEALTRSGFDATTFAGELRQTMSMLAGAGTRLIRGLQSAKKAKTWADAWLEWRYGWRPLLSDMRAIQAAMSEKKSFTYYKRRSGFSSSRTVNSTYNVDSGSALHTFNRQLLLDFRYQGNAYSMIRPETIHTDILPTAWELLRFSFVVDWFVNVGSTLSALSGSLRTPDLICSAGVEVQADLRCLETGWTNHTGWVVSGASYSSQTLGVMRIRQPWPPSYRPTVRLNLDAAKLLDLFLIFRRPFRGRRYAS